MKKFTIQLIMALVIFPMLSLFAQEKGTKEILFFDGFSGLDFPPTGWSWIDEEQPDNWYLYETNYALGEAAPELYFRWYPPYIGTAGIKSPAIDTEGYSSVYLNFNLQRGWYNTYGGYNFYIETTSDGGATWNQVWIGENPEAHIDPEEVVIFIDNEDVGSDQFQFAVRFDGDASYIDAWYFDDFEISYSVLYDAVATEIFLPKLWEAGETLIPTVVVTNAGSETINFDINFEFLLDGSISSYNETLNITDFAPNTVDTIEFPGWDAPHGNYEAVYSVLLEDDQNPDNNQLFDAIKSIDNPADRKPLLELFTSSTCDPCVSGNMYLHNLLNSYPETYSLIKYQMNWPGVGDPYYTEEGGVRRFYYDVNSVPSLWVNANDYHPSSTFFPAETYESYLGNVSPFEMEIISAVYNDEHEVTIELNINPLIDFEEGLTAHIAVVEKLTTGNIGTNGETEFDQVMMKMLPTASGTTLDALILGTPVTISETTDMDDTFMEEIDDLAVVVFIQDDTDKYVMQSEMTDVVFATGIDTESISANSVQLYPNPAKNKVCIETTNSINKVQLMNLAGQVVLEQVVIGNKTELNTSEFNSGIYFIKVFSHDNVITRKLVIE